MIPSPGLQRSPRIVKNRPSHSEPSTGGWEKINLKKFTTPLEPESRDVSYWNYGNDCFRVDRKQFEDNGFSSPEQFFTPDSWREREEMRLKRLSGTTLTPEVSFDDLKVQGTSVGKDETNSHVTKDSNQKDPRLGKICGTQNYYKLDPADCDADYASLCINGQKASVKSPGTGSDIPPVYNRDEEEKEYVFSFGKCGRVAVLTPITEVPSQCATPYRLTFTPTFPEDPLSPVSSISFESLLDCSLMKNQYLRCERNDYEISPSPQYQPEQFAYVPSSDFVKKSKSEKAVPQDPLVKRFELLSILPERTRAAYNLPPIPVSQFGVPGLSVSSAPLLNRYFVRKIEEKPKNMYAYKCLPPLYPTGHLEKGVGNKRLPIGRSKSVYGLTSETRRVMNSDCRSVNKPDKNGKAEDDEAKFGQPESNRRKSDSDMRDSNAKLPPLRKLSRKKLKKCNKKRNGERGPKKSKDKKVASHATIIDPSPWIERSRNLVVVSEVETMVGEKITHTYNLVDQDEPEEKLESLSWSHTNHELKSDDSDCGWAQKSESLSKGSVKKKKKRKHGFRNRKK